MTCTIRRSRETKGEYDGRWLFVNEMNGRVARIDLRDFKTKQILGPVPNVSGNHGSSFVTPNTEYTMMASRFSIPLPKGTYAPVDKYATDTRACSPASRSTRSRARCRSAWQILTPPFDWDLGDAGKLASDGWMFWSSYNSERATGKLEVTASQRDRDYIAAVNWRAAEQAAAEGKAIMIGGVRVIDPKKVPGIVYLVPCGKSPHGVDVSPDGKFIIGSGKLQGVTTAFSFEKIQNAIRNKDFTGEEDGIPVLKYESVKEAEVPVGLGPLHTQFGPNGMAYTSLFVDSAVASWKLGEWQVIDKVPVAYAIGHLSSAEGDTVEPGRELPDRAEQAVARAAPVGGAVAAGVVAARGHLEREDEDSPRRVHRAGAALRADDQGRQAQADRGLPERREQASARDLGRQGRRRDAAGQQGDREDDRGPIVVHAAVVRGRTKATSVTVAITNIEQTTDELHGFGLLDYNINLVIDPGETKAVTFTAKARRLPVLLHQLLFGAASGDAGLFHRETPVVSPSGPGVASHAGPRFQSCISSCRPSALDRPGSCTSRSAAGPGRCCSPRPG